MTSWYKFLTPLQSSLDVALLIHMYPLSLQVALRIGYILQMSTDSYNLATLEMRDVFKKTLPYLLQLLVCFIRVAHRNHSPHQLEDAVAAECS